MGDAALQGDRFDFSPAWGFTARTGISAFAMFDDLGRPFERTEFAHAGDVLPIPLDAKHEIFIGIETLCVDAELCHAGCSLRRDLAGHLLNLNNHELGRLERGKAHDDVDYS